MKSFDFDLNLEKIGIFGLVPSKSPVYVTAIFGE